MRWFRAFTASPPRWPRHRRRRSQTGSAARSACPRPRRSTASPSEKPSSNRALMSFSAAARSCGSRKSLSGCGVVRNSLEGRRRRCCRRSSHTRRSKDTLLAVGAANRRNDAQQPEGVCGIEHADGSAGRFSRYACARACSQSRSSASRSTPSCRDTDRAGRRRHARQRGVLQQSADLPSRSANCPPLEMDGPA